MLFYATHVFFSGFNKFSVEMLVMSVEQSKERKALLSKAQKRKKERKKEVSHMQQTEATACGQGSKEKRDSGGRGAIPEKCLQQDLPLFWNMSSLTVTGTEFRC